MTAEPSLQQRFGLQVTPQNVLGVRAVVLQEAQDLQDLLKNELEQTYLPALGGDLVSADMSAAFNEATVQLLARAKDHIKSLFDLGDELRASANAYGHTEAEIDASFSHDSARTSASRLSPMLREVAGMGRSTARPSAQTTRDLITGHQL